MDEELDDDEDSQEEVLPPAKRFRKEPMVLDEEEAGIASGLRPICGTSEAASRLEQDETQSQDGDAGAPAEVYGEGAKQGGGVVDDFRGDGNDVGFSDNGVCH